jgi:DNA repair protein RadC
MLQHQKIPDLLGVKFTDFSDFELLELLLEIHTDSQTGQVLARICERRFGSLKNLVTASAEAMCQIGLPSQVILALRLFDTVTRRIQFQAEVDHLITLGDLKNAGN